MANQRAAGRRRPLRGRSRRPLRGRKGAIGYLLAVAAALAAVVTAGPAPALAQTDNWIITSWNVHLLNQASPATASHFFNTPGSYGTSSQPTGTSMDGLAASPALWYASYARFVSNVNSGAITYPYHWVYYDPEHWAQTPLAEQQHPGKYLRLFGQFAHAHGFKVMEAPARDLGLTTGSTCPERKGEVLNQWYIRCNIPGLAAPWCDIFVTSGQTNVPNISEYDWVFTNAKREALAANSHAVVDASLSTHHGTPAQMVAAAQSVKAAGFYVTITSNAISNATQFFQRMQAAGY